MDDLRTCNKCGLTKLTSEFLSNGYQPSGKKKYKPKCKNCTYEDVNSIFKERKAKYVELKCTICGYDKCEKALEFHHRDPNQKELKISDMRTASEKRIKAELEKCVILCANCHREVHSGFYPDYLVDENR